MCSLFTCSVLLLVAKTEFTLYTLFTELYISTGIKMSRYVRPDLSISKRDNESPVFSILPFPYSSVSLFRVNIRDQTIQQNSPYIFPHVQSHSPWAPPWPSPPACCGLVHRPITMSLLLPPDSSPPGAVHQQRQPRLKT